MGRIVISAYHPKPQCEDKLIALVREHVSQLRSWGLATDRTPICMRAQDGTILEVFEWVSEAAIEQAHEHPEVQRLWEAFNELCEYRPLASIAETAELFADFEPL